VLILAYGESDPSIRGYVKELSAIVLVDVRGFVMVSGEEVVQRGGDGSRKGVAVSRCLIHPFIRYQDYQNSTDRIEPIASILQ
jgi:hypothetical protein